MTDMTSTRDALQQLVPAGPSGSSATTTGAAPSQRRDFQIVPLRGLPVVAAVLAGLVATIATNALWAVDFFHVVGGGIWTTLDLFLV